MDPIDCPQCKSILILPDHYAGKKTTCPGCKGAIEVPAAEPKKPESPPAEEADPPQIALRERLFARLCPRT